MLQALVSLVLVVGIFCFVLGQFADLSSVWGAIRTLTWGEVGAGARCRLEPGHLLDRRWWSPRPGCAYPQAMVLTESTTAVSNALPAGGAIGVGLTYSILGPGASPSRGPPGGGGAGIWNNFAKLGMPVVAVALLVTQGQPGGGRMFAAFAGLAGLVGAILVFSALILRSEDFARRAGLVGERRMTKLRGLVPAGPVEAGTTRVQLPEPGHRPGQPPVAVAHRRHRRRAPLAVSVLLMTLRAMGVSDDEVSWAQVLAAFAFARLITAIP